MTMQPTDLTQDTAIVAGLELLPADPERDTLAETYRKRTRQLCETIERTDTTAARITAIAETLPDADDTERDALTRERSALIVEQLTSATDRGIAARNYADALQAWAVSLVDAATAEQRKIRPDLDRIEAAHGTALGKLQSVSPTDPAYGGLYKQFQKIDAERRPVAARYDQLRQLQQTVTTALAAALQTDPTVRVKLHPDTARPVSDPTPRFVAHIAGEAA